MISIRSRQSFTILTGFWLKKNVGIELSACFIFYIVFEKDYGIRSSTTETLNYTSLWSIGSNGNSTSKLIGAISYIHTLKFIFLTNILEMIDVFNKNDKGCAGAIVSSSLLGISSNLQSCYLLTLQW